MKLIKEHIDFERGVDPKKAMRIGGFNLRQVYKSTVEAGMNDWEKYLNQFVGKNLSFVVAEGISNPKWAETGKRITVLVHSWGKHFSTPDIIWVFDDSKRPMVRINVDLDENIYIDNES